MQVEKKHLLKKNEVRQRATGVRAVMLRVKDTGVMYAKIHAGAEGRTGIFQRKIVSEVRNKEEQG